MTTLTQPRPVATEAEPHVRRWTKEEYYRLGELGFFTAEKAELLEGVIVVTSPQKWPHYLSLDRAAEFLRSAFGTGVWVRQQAPLDLGLVLEPEPDISIVTGSREDYSAHPTTALLIVEVSETTLAFDQTQKASLYARAGISDYWIVNLVQDQLEIYRDPMPDATQPHGHRYSSVTVHAHGALVSPLTKPGLAIAVADLLG